MGTTTIAVVIVAIVIVLHWLVTRRRMSEVHRKTRTGHPNQVASALRRAVNAHVRDANGHDVVRFKIGRTSEPEKRARGRDYSVGYDKMIVLYETNDPDHADDVERHLIDWSDGRSDNKKRGGAGPIGDEPYYVYVVIRRSRWRKVVAVCKHKWRRLRARDA
jgi:hypothetical protein